MCFTKKREKKREMRKRTREREREREREKYEINDMVRNYVYAHVI